MSYELLQQGPAAYIPVLLLSLIITVVAYGAFPFIFAKVRNTPITKKKYRWLCYGINVAVMAMFIAINGEASNGGPYLLWTSIFYGWGTRILEDKGLLDDGTYTSGVCIEKPVAPLVARQEQEQYAKREEEARMKREQSKQAERENPPERIVVSVDRSEETLACPNCNRVQRSDRKFCYNCGAVFED